MAVELPSVGCSKCGAVGIHACTGTPMRPWTEQEEKDLNEALSKLFDFEKSVAKPGEGE